jgi:lipoprotein NlpD
MRLQRKCWLKKKIKSSPGKKIATMGKQGDQPGLHFEIRQNGKPVDPLKFLPKR